MSLVTEDGSVVAGAESYITVAYSLTYHANRGNTTWSTITTAQQEQALRRATDYMVQMYRNRWIGYRFNNTQKLDWPRLYVPYPDYIAVYGMLPAYIPDNVVPEEVKNACCELALKAAAGELLSDADQVVIREKIGPIETEYDKYSPQHKRYMAIDAMVAVYFVKHGGMQVQRA
jgi:hypothetical protein